MTRVAIVAARAVWRAGLQSLLASQPGIEVAGAVADFAAMANLADERAIDVVLAQVEDLPTDLEEAMHHLPPCVLLTADRESGSIAEALRAGARAVLPGDSTPEQMAAAAVAAASGLAVLQPEDLAAVLAGPPPAHEALIEPLTPREIDVLRRMAEGLSNKLIAAALNISDHTVKFHIASIMGKLDANTRTDAVMRGVRRGLVVL